MGQETKKYDAWLHWSLTDKCNLRCNYCIAGSPSKKNAGLSEINIPALLGTLKRTNKIFRIGLTGGGEPFLVPNFVEACEAITERHYILLLTNLTSSRVKEFAKRINPERVLQITASTHIEELERCKLTDVYVAHFLLLKERGFDVRAREVAHPLLSAEAGHYKQFFKLRGIDLEFEPFLGEFRGEKYPASYSERELKIFDFRESKKSILERYCQYGKVCNAGYNTGVVDPEGNISSCYLIKDKIGNIYNNILFREERVVCPFKICYCPLNEFDPYLFKKSMEECGPSARRAGFFVLRHLLVDKINKIAGILGIFLRVFYPRGYINSRNFYDKLCHQWRSRRKSFCGNSHL
ncbi:MAG: Radical SAM domain protein [Parcubacteria group bacterium GW2011_GWC2_45_7]|nr:MAG: Radical SAM domain protein [Parcubacteria group bacterium GW2011_GWC2_45_7]